MSAELEKQLENLFGTPLETLVKADDPARVVWGFVQRLDMEALGFSSRFGLPGRTGFSHQRLLALWLLCFWKKVQSTRQLEEACRSHISFIWLCNYQPPDHNTLWRFFKTHHEKFPSIFKASVKQAAELQLIGGKLMALDGTKLKGAASSHRNWRKESIEKKLAKVQKEAEELARQILAAGNKAEDDEQSNSIESLEEAVAAHEQTIEDLKNKLKALEEQNANRLAPTDLDARHMKTTGGYRMGYNAQVVADEQHGILVQSVLTQSQTDHHELVPMLEMTSQMLAEVGEGLKDCKPMMLADTGYNSNAGLAEAEGKGHPVLVNVDKGMKSKRENRYDSSRFEFDPEKNVLICPEGKELKFLDRTKKKGSFEVRYACNQGATCPVAAQCTKNKKGRMVALMAGHEATQRMRNKLADEENAALLKMRSQIVERPFAEIKETMGFRRFTVRGLKKSSSQWAIVSAAYNLRRMKEELLAMWGKVPGGQIGAKNPCFGLISRLRFFVIPHIQQFSLAA